MVLASVCAALMSRGPLFGQRNDLDGIGVCQSNHDPGSASSSRHAVRERVENDPVIATSHRYALAAVRNLRYVEPVNPAPVRLQQRWYCTTAAIVLMGI